MSRYLGVEMSTDMRNPRVQLTWLRGEGNVSQFLDFKPKLTHDDPAAARNWHHNVRHVVVLPAGWRVPKREVQAYMDRHRGSAYRPDRNAGVRAIAIADCEEVRYSS